METKYKRGLVILAAGFLTGYLLKGLLQNILKYFPCQKDAQKIVEQLESEWKKIANHPGYNPISKEVSLHYKFPPGAGLEYLSCLEDRVREIGREKGVHISFFQVDMEYNTRFYVGVYKPKKESPR
ncbi:hypothetical protein HYT53_06225 [Candidatus Woesearchaeota archaeon]|nr:hypothetical protein [Candidatus Woesearchaeota archaeon]